MLIVGVYLLQEKIIFQSDGLDKNYIFSFEQPFTEISIKTIGEYDLSGILFSPTTKSSKGTILYFHGNANNMQRWGNYAVDFTKLGYHVLMIDYAGFGKSQGRPDEEVLYQNAEDTWQWAQHHLPSKNFIIYGRSLGTGVASYLASTHQASQLILETPFYALEQSQYKIFFPFGLKYDFPTYSYLTSINYPINIIQGTNDWVVPLSSAKKLKPLLKANDGFFVIKKGSHKNLREFDEYHRILEKIL